MNQHTDRYQLRGLCVTCNHAATCTYLTHAGGPIWQCEEFDDFPALHVEPSGPAPAALATRPRVRSETDLVDAASGLCGNCDHRASCALPNAGRGSWYCEEYA